MVAQAGGAAGIVLINDQEGSSIIHYHITFYSLLVFYFLLFGDYVYPFSSGNDTFSCYSLDLVEMACPNNSTVSNVTIPVVTISKAGGDVIDKYISAGKKGKVLASFI